MQSPWAAKLYADARARDKRNPPRHPHRRPRLAPRHLRLLAHQHRLQPGRTPRRPRLHHDNVTKETETQLAEHLWHILIKDENRREANMSRRRGREDTRGRLCNPARLAQPRQPAIRASHFPDPRQPDRLTDTEHPTGCSGRPACLQLTIELIALRGEVGARNMTVPGRRRFGPAPELCTGAVGPGYPGIYAFAIAAANRSELSPVTPTR
jgi:hypothetical protein